MHVHGMLQNSMIQKNDIHGPKCMSTPYPVTCTNFKVSCARNDKDRTRRVFLNYIKSKQSLKITKLTKVSC